MPDLHKLIEEILPLARTASEQAYSPYSNVKVGAVVVNHDGLRFTGCNVENASYGLTQCAERNALAAAVVAGERPGTIRALLVFATGFKTLSPCGACRQVMAELLADDAMIISCSDSEAPKWWTLQELFPDPFTLE
jgi:cytidine deaminase